ncbi:MAG TPA: YggS family pyridoxal phosphate-dependent enzyme [Cytophagales bacterium]|nr:YggS family pyridoxal phosphate-dependent enzyme [Cytophagales bacterium]HAA20332.1 YggS family pyridoxal phosphate-dependent enzyme [Cytophagales bacterium]HAP62905.1 YggS family pyridoxal phosphate-dependent enzyme [Cytophagales bacterium]
MEIGKNLDSFRAALAGYPAQLVAISKTKPLDALQAAYDAGQRDFGENKVQEMTDKAETLPKDIRWHMVGHLQTNKVKYLAPYVHLIHSVDSLKLIKEINKQAAKHDRVIHILLQMHIAEEDTKFGLDQQELNSLIQEFLAGDFPHVRIVGLMGMATNTDNETQVRKEFAGLKTLFEQTKSQYAESLPDFTEISMGMSGDYQIAIEEGSTLVRVGSAIFGARNYG